MDNTIFAQSIARIRFLETKMIDRSKVEALVEAKGFEDCMRLLQDTPYNEYLTNASYEEGLKMVLQELYRNIQKITPLREVVDILSVRYDGHNIKSLIKGKLTGTDTRRLILDAGTMPVETLEHMIKEENFRDMPKTLRAYVERALEDFKNSEDPQEIDITIDKGMFQYMLEIARNSGMGYLINIARLMVDMVNIKAFIRIKLQDRGREFLQKVYVKGGHLDIDVFVNYLNDSLENFANRIFHTDHFKWVREGIGEYIKGGDLGSIEKYGDNYLLDYLKKAKLVSFGPEPIIAYIIARENEIKILRIILTGMKNEVRPEIIRERLRDVYV